MISAAAISFWKRNQKMRASTLASVEADGAIAISVCRSSATEYGSRERALMPRETLPRKSGRHGDTDSSSGEDHTLARYFPGDRIFSYECNIRFLCANSRVGPRAKQDNLYSIFTP